MTDHELREDIVFAAEEDTGASRFERKAWKLLIVDDEEDVHSITRMVLDGFEFEGARLEFLSAYSADEGRQVMAQNPDIAVMLLDVVMETPHAGLDLARQVREELDNQLVRIILRTGQPGQAPERQVIINYDINDYKSKSELTAQKLFTAVTTGIRSYRDLRAIESSRQGLEDIIAASADLFQADSLELFARGVLTQMTSLLHLEDSSMYLGDASGFAARDRLDDFIIIAGTGDFSNLESRLASEVLDAEEMDLIRRAASADQCFFSQTSYAGCFGMTSGTRHVLFLRVLRELTPLEQDLVQVFAANVTVAFENLQLNQEIAQTHREVIFTLGEVVENRALSGGMHVRRVAEMAWLLGRHAGLSVDDCDLLRLAIPMHDVGKVAIPDSVLLKAGPLDEAERGVMEQHPRLGFDILNRSGNHIMQTAARVALEHQEAWDGSGYPSGLAGESIHIFSRIARVVDVLDSLLSARVYKEAWSVSDALAYMQDQRARIFDPALIDTLFAHRDEFLALRDNIILQSQDIEMPPTKKKP
ncbi:MAG: response regulator receiver protein [Deltaproteobacteria bacterium HGW-Deltaproteobacteria-18]|jgi:response regulator RpfG family c-di-GMP phosphodiesterase|nr:MAG: response regulator receiver protein [Deltaproteobacteria bacterium HGW-Deltaproteobacteria-18]